MFNYVETHPCFFSSCWLTFALCTKRRGREKMECAVASSFILILVSLATSFSFRSPRIVAIRSVWGAKMMWWIDIFLYEETWWRVHDCTASLVLQVLRWPFKTSMVSQSKQPMHALCVALAQCHIFWKKGIEWVDPKECSRSKFSFMAVMTPDVPEKEILYAWKCWSNVYHKAFVGIHVYFSFSQNIYLIFFVSQNLNLELSRM